MSPLIAFRFTVLPAVESMTALAGFGVIPIAAGLRFVWSSIAAGQSVDAVYLRLWRQSGGSRPSEPSHVFPPTGHGTVADGAHAGKCYVNVLGLTVEPWEYEVSPWREEA